MKEIQLTHGKVAIVNDDLYEYFTRWEWQAYCVHGKWYARRTEGRKTIKMHREVMQAPDGVEVDHRDGDGLHNWRENLRFCTHAQNMANRKISENNTSGFKGVTWSWWAKKWRARVGRKNNVGYFNTAEEAARAYDAKARELFGEFAKTNFDN